MVSWKISDKNCWLYSHQLSQRLSNTWRLTRWRIVEEPCLAAERSAEFLRRFWRWFGRPHYAFVRSPLSLAMVVAFCGTMHFCRQWKRRTVTNGLLHPSNCFSLFPSNFLTYCGRIHTVALSWMFSLSRGRLNVTKNLIMEVNAFCPKKCFIICDFTILTTFVIYLESAPLYCMKRRGSQ